jgi:hypothetical protein
MVGSWGTGDGDGGGDLNSNNPRPPVPPSPTGPTLRDHTPWDAARAWEDWTEKERPPVTSTVTASPAREPTRSPEPSAPSSNTVASTVRANTVDAVSVSSLPPTGLLYATQDSWQCGVGHAWAHRGTSPHNPA